MSIGLTQLFYVLNEFDIRTTQPCDFGRRADDSGGD